VYGSERELSCFQYLLVFPIGELRSWAEDIWRKEGFQRPIPKIVAGRGIRYMDEYMSFSQGDLIVLSRQQRNRLILLHEICHYLGSDRELDHGPAFQNRYAVLFSKYIV